MEKRGQPSVIGMQNKNMELRKKISDMKASFLVTMDQLEKELGTKDRKIEDMEHRMKTVESEKEKKIKALERLFLRKVGDYAKLEKESRKKADRYECEIKKLEEIVDKQAKKIHELGANFEEVGETVKNLIEKLAELEEFFKWYK